MKIREATRSNLQHILKGGATSRILDLHSIAKRHGHLDDHEDRPFFAHKRLNRCFIVKHTVRAHERPYVMSSQPVVTKVLVPLAEEELGLGGHAVFVEEVGFARKMRALFDNPDDPHQIELDLIRLRELAALPSFDPFLLSERYLEHARPISPLYFDLAPDELAEMEKAVSSQIVSVIALAFGGSGDQRDATRARNFTQQLLAGDTDGRMRMLRRSLDMTALEFKTGIFGWKGILYYRWRMHETLGELRGFVNNIRDVSILGASETESFEIEQMRRAIITETRARWSSLTQIMAEYETVFARFCSGEDVSGFRAFLLRAPSLFYDIGSDLSVVSHVPGYWKFWSAQNKKGYFHAREAMPLFSSFMSSVTRATRSTEHVPDGIGYRRDSVIPHPEMVRAG